MNELKLCPSCRSSADADLFINENIIVVRVKCTNCDKSITWAFPTEGHDPDKDDIANAIGVMVDRWNSQWEESEGNK